MGTTYVADQAELLADTSLRHRAPVRWPWLLVAAAWGIFVLASLTNQRYLIDHHALMTQSGLPWLGALAVFLGLWQLMLMAMMLPVSMPMVCMMAYASRKHPRPYTVVGAFLAGYAAIWTAFAVAAFIGDTFIHHALDAWPWLGAHSFLIGAGTLAIAGSYQFSPLKRRCLSASCDPGAFLQRYHQQGMLPAWRLGLRHGIFCLGCCWALMLLMFGVEIGGLVGMAALTGMMLIEKALPASRRIVPALGILLLALAALWLLHPAWLLHSVAGAPAAPDTGAIAVGHTQYVAAYAITLQATPAEAGANTFIVTLKDAQGRSVNGASVGIETTMLDMDMGHQHLSLQPMGKSAPGVYRGRGDLAMAGHWELVAQVTLAPSRQSFQATFLLTAS